MEPIVKSRIIALTIAVTALAGCATTSTPEVPLAKQAQANIDRIEGVLVIPQNRLNVTVEASNPYAVGGVVGVLVAAAIDTRLQADAEKAAIPILESSRDYNFRAALLDASTDELSKIDKVKFALPLSVKVDESESARKIAFDQSTASALLFCNVDYRLESGKLIVTAKAEMYPKIDSLKQFRIKPNGSNPLGNGNAIYRKVFTLAKESVTPTTVNEKLSEAVADVARQLAADINQSL